MLLPFCLLMVPYLADVVAILWLMLLPLVVGNCVAMLADVIAIVFLLIDGTNCAVVAIIVPHCGSIVFLWQILLPGWLMLLPLCCCVADIFATMADVVAIYILLQKYLPHSNTMAITSANLATRSAREIQYSHNVAQ